MSCRLFINLDSFPTILVAPSKEDLWKKLFSTLRFKSFKQVFALLASLYCSNFLTKSKKWSQNPIDCQQAQSICQTLWWEGVRERLLLLKHIYCYEKIEEYTLFETSTFYTHKFSLILAWYMQHGFMKLAHNFSFVHYITQFWRPFGKEMKL